MLRIERLRLKTGTGLPADELRAEAALAGARPDAPLSGAPAKRNVLVDQVIQTEGKAIDFDGSVAMRLFVVDWLKERKYSK